jgi:hypothetical protein
MTLDNYAPQLTNEQKANICGILSVGCDRETAANFVGCTTADIGRTMRQDPAFAANVHRTEAGCELSHMQTVKEAAKEPKNWRASVWWMERHAPERFGPRGAGVVTIRQLDEFLNVLTDLISEEVDCDDIQRRILARMADALRALEELVRMSALAASVVSNRFPMLEPFAALEDSSAEDPEMSEEEF